MEQQKIQELGDKLRNDNWTTAIITDLIPRTIFTPDKIKAVCRNLCTSIYSMPDFDDRMGGNLNAAIKMAEHLKLGELLSFSSSPVTSGYIFIFKNK